MKKLLFIILILLPGLQVMAQGVGIEIGAAMNSIRGTMFGNKIDAAMRPGLRIGVVADEGLSDNLSFQYGAFYSAKAGNTKYNSSFMDGGVMVNQQTDAYIRLDYAEVPLSLIYNTHSGKGNFFFGGGPYVGFAFGGIVDFRRSFQKDGSVTELNSVYPVSIGQDAQSDFNFLDAGLQVQLGYEIAKGLYTRAHASYGLADINPTENKMKNAGFGLTLGYMIR